MSDEPEQPLDPFPTTIPTVSPFPPLENEPVTDWVQQADAHDLAVQHGRARENKLAALGRFAFPPSPPLDDEGVAARDRRWTSRTVFFLAIFMLIFNAASIQNWSRQQAPGWITSTVQQLSDVWSAQLTQLGADQPRQAVRTAYDNARDARFPGQEPAQP